jgi:hypothetical protein
MLQCTYCPTHCTEYGSELSLMMWFVSKRNVMGAKAAQHQNEG